MRGREEGAVEARQEPGGKGSSARRAGRGWIVGGAVLLAVLVLVALFSLGVCVGRRGWGAGPPGVQGPGQVAVPQGQPQQPAPQPPTGDQGAQPPAQAEGVPWPAERPALRGVIRSVGPEGVVVDTPQGPRFVGVTGETRLTRLAQEGEMEIEKLCPGWPVDVFGGLEPDGRTLTAERVVVLSQQR